VVVALGTVDPALVTGVLGEELAFVADPTDQDTANAVGAIVRADAIVDSAFLARAQRLRVLARTGVGVDHVDLQAAMARGVPVVITPGSGTRAVAEGVFALALHLLKRLGRSTDLVRHGQWADRGQLSMGDLDGATIGIIGYGRIGRRVGDLAEAFGRHLMAYDPFSARRLRSQLLNCWSSPRQATSHAAHAADRRNSSPRGRGISESCTARCDSDQLRPRRVG
jgi:phosphoglycerate dehydrogenase-like enzyme